jgi:hypothetical protein
MSEEAPVGFKDIRFPLKIPEKFCKNRANPSISALPKAAWRRTSVEEMEGSTLF